MIMLDKRKREAQIENTTTARKIAIQASAKERRGHKQAQESKQDRIEELRQQASEKESLKGTEARNFREADIEEVGYHQIWVLEDDIPRTCISNYTGHTSLELCPLVSQCSTHFKALMNEVIAAHVRGHLLIHLMTDARPLLLLLQKLPESPFATFHFARVPADVALFFFPLAGLPFPNESFIQVVTLAKALSLSSYRKNAPIANLSHKKEESYIKQATTILPEEQLLSVLKRPVSVLHSNLRKGKTLALPLDHSSGKSCRKETCNAAENKHAVPGDWNPLRQLNRLTIARRSEQSCLKPVRLDIRNINCRRMRLEFDETGEGPHTSPSSMLPRAY
ncbi:hypothetical protein Tco_0884495 [Tanacetum coccineum]